MPRLVGLAATMLAIATPATSAAAPLEITVEERSPMLLVFSTPSTPLRQVGLTDLNAELTDALRETVKLPLEEIDTDAVRRCMTDPGEKWRLRCLVLSTATATVANPNSRFLLVVSARGTSEGDIATMVLIDVAETAKLRTQAGFLEVPNDVLEESLASRAVAATVPPTPIPDRNAVGQMFRSALTGPLHGPLEKAGALAEHGAVEVQTTATELEVRIDGRVVGVSGSARTFRLVGVPPGPHEVELSGPHVHPFEGSVTVTAGRTSKLAAPVELVAPPVYGWTYYTLVVAGAALAVGGIVTSQVAPRESFCLGVPEPSGGSCGPSALENLSIGSASVVALGVGWAGASAVFWDETRPPWLELLTGAALGVVTAVSMLVVKAAQ